MHADAWAAIAQWATAGIAFGAAVFARGQVREARKTRERVAQPDVVVYVDRHEVRRYMDLVIKNFGQTTAYNIRLKLPPLQVAPYRNIHTGQEVKHLYVPQSIAVLAPGQEWRTVWDSAARRRKYEGTLQDQFIGHVDFDDKMIPDKPSYRNPISLDIKMFWNTTYVTEHKSETVEKALYDIAGTLKDYGQEHSGVWVYTNPGDEEQHRREQEHEELLRAEDEFLRDMGVVRDDRLQGTTEPDEPDV
ncbi:hypothetical protein [Mycobacterium sp. IS-1264]|uniref:hypothetical protein n=1 Tax=Mycobacterium sp. IS-1264 TaxID=1834158 RepID=UPI001F0AC1CF|nr:hypothetical protein [Mycobacterium sp. IS-1264]